MMMADALKIQANRRGDMRLDSMVMRRNTSATIHSTARNLTLDLSRPPGNDVLNTVNSLNMKSAVPIVLLATNDVQAVAAHHAVIKPKKRPYFLPPASAAQT